MSLPPVFPASYYRLLARGAKELGISRAKLAVTAIRHYLKAVASQNAPKAKALGSEDLAQKFAEAQRKIAKEWWSTLSPEEKAARTKKANQARWPKKKK